MSEAQVKARIKSLYKLDGDDIYEFKGVDFLPTERGPRSSPIPTPDFILTCHINDNAFEQWHGGFNNLSFYFYKKELCGVAVLYSSDIVDDVIEKAKKNYGNDYSVEHGIPNDTYIWTKVFVDVYLKNPWYLEPTIRLFVFSKAICDAAYEDELQAQKEEKARQQKALDEKKEKITF